MVQKEKGKLKMEKILAEKHKALKENLLALGSVAVAFSGGVDSTFLLAAAKEALGKNAIAITIRSGFVPAAEVEEATNFSRELGIYHELIDVDELAIEGVADNPPDRCYLCKKALFTRLKARAGELGVNFVVDGSNLDDVGDYRPGMRALAELDIKSPLREANLNKEEIRSLSQAMNLPTWDKPSFACLASRIPYGEKITKEKLLGVEKAEVFLMAQGFRQMRVRCHGNLARIEVPEEEFAKLADAEMRKKVDEAFKKIGFAYTAIDIKGYRTGSLNEVLK